jgi:protein-disulfide isomerase
MNEAKKYADMNLQTMKEEGQIERKIITACKREEKIKQNKEKRIKGKESKAEQSKAKQREYYSMVEV